jgi:hypothetical protein
MIEIIPIEKIKSKIYSIRNQKVMFDRNLADLCGVEIRILVQAVKRNISRFPDDFMFQLSKVEFLQPFGNYFLLMPNFLRAEQ